MRGHIVTDAFQAPIVLCDVDGVVARFGDHVRDTARAYLSQRSAQNRMEIQALVDGPTVGDVIDRLLDYLAPLVTAPGWCASMPVDDEGRGYIDGWRQAGARVLFVTAPFRSCPTWEFERRAWAERELGAAYGDVISGSAKEHVDGIVLVEDRGGLLRSWNTRRTRLGRMPGLLIAREWNANEEGHDDVIRLGWPELDAVVRGRIAYDLMQQGRP